MARPVPNFWIFPSRTIRPSTASTVVGLTSGSILQMAALEIGVRLFRTVAKEQKCQVIATTHSYECLESAVNQAKDTGMDDDFCYFRLGRNKKDETVAYRLSQDLLAHATDNALEVR